MEEVHGEDRLGLGLQKRMPGLPGPLRGGVDARVVEKLPHCRRTGRISQAGQVAMNAPVPQPGLSRAISSTSARIACAVRGRPGARCGKVQRLRTRLACQRSKVRGEMIRRDWRSWLKTHAAFAVPLGQAVLAAGGPVALAADPGAVRDGRTQRTQQRHACRRGGRTRADGRTDACLCQGPVAGKRLCLPGRIARPARGAAGLSALVYGVPAPWQVTVEPSPCGPSWTGTPRTSTSIVPIGQGTCGHQTTTTAPRPPLPTWALACSALNGRYLNR